MSFWYTYAKLRLATADFDAAAATIKADLVMSNTSADTDEDAEFITNITTLDVYDGSGYAQATLASLAAAADTANDRAAIDCDPFTFGATVAAGTRQAVGILLRVQVGGSPNTAVDWPLAYIDSGGFPFDGNGGAINVTPHANGLLLID